VVECLLCKQAQSPELKPQYQKKKKKKKKKEGRERDTREEEKKKEINILFSIYGFSGRTVHKTLLTTSGNP
jgi:hypothetical protein